MKSALAFSLVIVGLQILSRLERPVYTWRILQHSEAEVGAQMYRAYLLPQEVALWTPWIVFLLYILITLARKNEPIA